MFDVKADHNDKVNADLQRTRLELDEVANKFDTNRNLLVETQLTAPSLVNTVDDETVGTRSLSVVRVRDGQAVTIDAPEHMELLPGDVLKVQRSAIPATLDGLRRIPANDTITKASNRQ